MAGRIADTTRGLHLLIRGLAAFCFIGICFGGPGALAQSSFYRAPPQDIAGRPGTARSSGKSRWV
jgi:hypothetical protein